MFASILSSLVTRRAFFGARAIKSGSGFVEVLILYALSLREKWFIRNPMGVGHRWVNVRACGD
jgi:hypothetical protein